MQYQPNGLIHYGSVLKTTWPELFTDMVLKQSFCFIPNMKLPKKIENICQHTFKKQFLKPVSKSPLEKGHNYRNFCFVFSSHQMTAWILGSPHVDDEVTIYHRGPTVLEIIISISSSTKMASFWARSGPKNLNGGVQPLNVSGVDDPRASCVSWRSRSMMLTLHYASI